MPDHGQFSDSLPVAFDHTARTYDANGWLHISRSHISKACVNPYLGREIPGWEQLGLEPEKKYYLLRDPEELRRAAPTFARIPVLNKHIVLSDFNTMDEKEKKKYIVGSTGSAVEYLHPFLDADEAIWDADAIAGIETDQQREHSCCYRYVPIMTTGVYEGQKYDGIMTQIEANHLALVESGRAGNDVLAADNKLETEPMKRTKLGNSLIVAFTTAFPKLAADSLEPVFGAARRKSFNKAHCVDAVMAMDSALDKKQVEVVMDALVNVDDPEPTKRDNEEEEPAKDCAECHGKDGKHGKDCKMGKDAEGCTCDAEEGEKHAKDCPMFKGAKDRKHGKDSDEEPMTKQAMDSALAAQRQQFKDADQAKRDVRKIVGDVVAMDSAAEIYTFALDHMKVDHTGVTDGAALKALFKLAESRQEPAPVAAMDHNSVSDALTAFPGLKRIRQ